MKPNLIAKLGVVLLVIAAVVVVLRLKQADSASSAGDPSGAISSVVLPGPAQVPPDPPDPPPVVRADTAAAVDVALPRLLDLGADKCIPCKKMAPMLVDLRKEFAGRFDVVFIDVWKNRDAAGPYGIKLIPTQIFFDAEGKELFRHQGFFSRDDILGAWSDLGYEFADAPVGAASTDRADGVVAYYFHWTDRCATCLEIEEYASIALRDAFSRELDAGRLEWRPCNMDLPEHEHFQRDFDLSAPSLVLVRFDDGEPIDWKVLADVWELAQRPPELAEYVRTETATYLSGSSGS